MVYLYRIAVVPYTTLRPSIPRRFYISQRVPLGARLVTSNHLRKWATDDFTLRPWSHLLTPIQLP